MKISPVLSTAAALWLVASAAHAGTVCIQDDTNGNALVLLKATFKRGKAGPASGYMAVYTGGSSFVARPITAGMVTSTGGYAGIGVTEYAPSITTNGSLSADITIFHRITCLLGDDGKIGVLDACSDLVTTLGSPPQSHAMHVVPCIDEYRIP